MAQSIQSVVFSKSESPSSVNEGNGWTPAAARAWCAEHDMRSDKMDETDSSYRFRQFDPEECDGGFQTLTEDMPVGVAMVSCSKRAAADGEHAYVTARQFPLYQSGRLVVRDLPGGGRRALVEKTLVQHKAAIDSDARTVTVVASDATLDRMGDTIDPAGWDITGYERNPVVMRDHSYRVENIIGQAERTWVEDGRLMQRHRIDPGEANPEAQSVWARILSGSLRAVSVGFHAVEWRKRKDADGEWTGGWDFLRQELLEVSWVAIPANPAALLSEAVSEGGRTRSLDRIATKLALGALAARIGR